MRLITPNHQVNSQKQTTLDGFSGSISDFRGDRTRKCHKEADGSWFRDISQSFLKEEEMVVNGGDSSVPWLYIPTQTSVTPAASEFLNQNNCFVIFKADGISFGTGPDFFTSSQSKLCLDNPYRTQEPYSGLVHVQRLDYFSTQQTNQSRAERLCEQPNTNSERV